MFGKLFSGIEKDTPDEDENYYSVGRFLLFLGAGLRKFIPGVDSTLCSITMSFDFSLVLYFLITINTLTAVRFCPNLPSNGAEFFPGDGNVSLHCSTVVIRYFYW